MIKTLQGLCEKSRCPSESKVFVYSFKTIRHRHKKYQGLSTFPSSTVSTFDEHLMLLGMNLTSTTTFKENRMTVLQLLQTAEEKDSAMLVKNWVQFLKCENFKKQGEPSLVITIHMPSWYGKSLYEHLDFSWGFVRSLLFLPHRLKARNQILHMRYYFNLPQAERNPVLLSLTVKMTSYWCRGTLCKLLVIKLFLLHFQ